MLLQCELNMTENYHTRRVTLMRLMASVHIKWSGYFNYPMHNVCIYLQSKPVSLFQCRIFWKWVSDWYGLWSNLGCFAVILLWFAVHINTLKPRQNGRHFVDDTFKRIFLKENVRISTKISLNFVPKSPIDNIPALFQIMAWRPGDKPLSEAMIVSLLTHICVARPAWVNRTKACLLNIFMEALLTNKFSTKYFLFIVKAKNNMIYRKTSCTVHVFLF